VIARSGATKQSSAGPHSGLLRFARNDALNDRIYDERRDYADFPSRIARQIFSGVSGMSMWVTPKSRSASTTAFTTAPSAGVVPPSPPARTPSGLVGEATSISSVRNDGSPSARGMA